MRFCIIILFGALFVQSSSSSLHLNHRALRQAVVAGSAQVNPAVVSIPVQQAPSNSVPVIPAAPVAPVQQPPPNSVPVPPPSPVGPASVLLNPVASNLVPPSPSNPVAPVPVPINPVAAIPAQPPPSSSSLPVNPAPAVIPAQPLPSSSSVPANPPVAVNPVQQPPASPSVPANPVVSVNPAQQPPPSPVAQVPVPVNPAVAVSPVQQTPSPAVGTAPVNLVEPVSPTEASSSSSESKDTSSGDDSSDYEDEDLTCYNKCIDLTSDSTITIDSYLKFASDVNQTDLPTTCPMYQSTKTCINDCPSSTAVTKFNEIYKLVQFLCVDRFADATSYFSCTLNDPRDYQEECDSETLSTVPPDDSRDIYSDVTLYCKTQRCMMRKKLVTVQQRCAPNVVQFARNYFKIDVDVTESSQEYGALWTLECIDLQKSLKSDDPL